MTYTALKYLHALTVAITLALFLLRGFWMLIDSPRLQARWVRITPHINDALLLFAAIAMLVVGSLNPLQQPWIMAKIIGLLAYIGLGTVALKRGKTRAIRVKALIAALAVFAYVAAVAVTKQVIPGVAF
ncbi:MAG: regulator SirB [Hydrogenophilales bacterium CG17_big_fil_post_rev_8_21_14_2_50_63_12]|nr:MAG: regulator SirB [Hydrogenophilales bacterium CG17_big_fil_post_rev_8_21_14_2_50_63_12]PIX97374.1 MAG: regulator SirB [Hydrogenophilales bacterium CG_4_10_14_3_um_filter_63_21]PJB04983.1 MAG: regulator SirB [Hydrogenophilales bacterium CG_4_9_14_3_um_filter_63_34]